MKKILVIGPVLKSEGGVTRFIKDYLEYDSGEEKRLFNIARPVKTRMRAYRVGYQELINAGIVRMIRGIMVTLFNILRFPFYLLMYRPHLLYINTVCYSSFWESSIYLMISKILLRKSVLHYLSSLHIFYGESGTTQKFLIRQVLMLPNHIIVLSKQSESLIKSFKKDIQVSYIPSNVETAVFSAETVPKFRDLPGKKYVLFIGGADPFRKGILDIFKAIPLVAGEYPDIRFIFTGGDNVLQFKKENKPENEYIHYTGWIAESDKVALYKSTDILILPSLNEGLPYVIIEALASGLPIVASRIGAIPEILDDGENGILITPGDYKALAEGILRLVQDAELYKKISAVNVEKARKCFEKSILLERIHSITESIVHSPQV